ncbi:Methionine aminopeptidase [uncultured archaeon]|nr:Methionine aminopeptidase [uncultured archaeon]
MTELGKLESYVKAGEVAGAVLKEAKNSAKPGMKLFDFAKEIEAMISARGAKPAFPVNLSINEAAAHQTPAQNELTVIGEKDILKIDVGVEVNGFIGDTAATVDFSGERGALVEASEKALEDAISCVRAGAKTSDVGKAVECAITSRGFRPIENLTGHSLGKYDLHAGIEVPNIETKNSFTLNEGDAIAIEPFATDGIGRVSEGPSVEIFALTDLKPVRQREARRMLTFIESNYRTLPFAERWLYSSFKSKLLVDSALRELVFSDCLRQYPILREVKKGMVSQAEATVIVEKDGCRITTKA